MTNIKFAIAALAVPILAYAVLRPVSAHSTKYELPSEIATLKKTSDPGFEMADGVCSACHSVDYISTQPPGKGRDFWTAEVKKMITVFGAPVEEADRQPIIDYLASNY
jgi:mono/diheme cytochrome c family protein